jgi:hypothetical protein
MNRKRKILFVAAGGDEKHIKSEEKEIKKWEYAKEEETE